MTVGYKGFEKGLICRGKQYKENTIFEEPEAVLCEAGMHYCKNPFDVLFYYPIIDENAFPAEYARIIDLGTSKENNYMSMDQYVSIDSKVCTNKIKIGNVIPFEDYCKLCIADSKFILYGIAILNNYIDFHNGSGVGGKTFIISFGMKNIINNVSDYCRIATFGNRSKIFNLAESCKLRIESHQGEIFDRGIYSEILINGDKNTYINAGDYNIIRFCGNDNMFLTNGDKNKIFLDSDNNTIEITGRWNKVFCSNSNNNIKIYTDEVLIKAPKGTKIQLIDKTTIDLYIENSDKCYTIMKGKLKEIEDFD